MTIYLLMTLYFLVPYWTKLEPQNFFSVHSLYCRIDAHLKIWGAHELYLGRALIPPGFLREVQNVHLARLRSKLDRKPLLNLIIDYIVFGTV